jgi:hypothetical protein
MAKLFFLGPKIMSSRLRSLDLDRYSLNDSQSGFLKGLKFIGIIGNNAYLAQTQVEQDLSALLVSSSVHCKPQLFIRFHGVCAVILKSVSPDLVQDTDSPSLLLLIDDRSSTFRLNHLEGLIELRSAVALDGTENVARQALRMDADKRRHIRFHLTFVKDNEFFVARKRTITGDHEITMFRGQFRDSDLLNGYRGPIGQTVRLKVRLIRSAIFTRHFTFDDEIITPAGSNVLTD